MDVFLSHSKQDRDFAVRLAADLDNPEIRMWVDEAEICAGDSLLERIESAMSQVARVVVILTGSSVQSKWVTREIDLALQREEESRDLRILPVLRDDCAVPEKLKDRLWVDFRDERRYAIALEELRRGLYHGSPLDDVLSVSRRVLLASHRGLEAEAALVRQHLERVNLRLSHRRVRVDTIEWDALFADHRALSVGPMSDSIRVADLTAAILLFGHEDICREPGCTLAGFLTATAGLRSGGAPRWLVYDLAGPRSAAGSSRIDALLSDVRERGHEVVACDSDQFHGQIGRDLHRLLEHLDKGIARTRDGSGSRSAPAPYRGLASYRLEHAPLFLGRDRLVTKLCEILAARPSGLLPIAGASGSGKSSLVRAGLFRRLQLGGVAGSAEWLFVDVSVARRALDSAELRTWLFSLADALRQQTALGELPEYQKTEALLEELRRADPSGSAGAELAERLVDRALADRSPGSRLVLFLDQFEEVFTVCDDEVSRLRYGLAAGRLAAEHERRRADQRDLFEWLRAFGRSRQVWLIIGIRFDFYDRLQATPLADLPEIADPVAVGPIRPEALYDVISEPAYLCGYACEDELVERILADVGTEPDVLPLLSFTLDELVKSSGGQRRLTLGLYGDLASASSTSDDARSKAEV